MKSASSFATGAPSPVKPVQPLKPLLIGGRQPDPAASANRLPPDSVLGTPDPNAPQVDPAQLQQAQQEAQQNKQELALAKQEAALSKQMQSHQQAVQGISNGMDASYAATKMKQVSSRLASLSGGANSLTKLAELSRSLPDAQTQLENRYKATVGKPAPPRISATPGAAFNAVKGVVGDYVRDPVDTWQTHQIANPHEAGTLNSGLTNLANGFVSNAANMTNAVTGSLSALGRVGEYGSGVLKNLGARGSIGNMRLQDLAVPGVGTAMWNDISRAGSGAMSTVGTFGPASLPGKLLGLGFGTAGQTQWSPSATPAAPQGAIEAPAAAPVVTPPADPSLPAQMQGWLASLGPRLSALLQGSSGSTPQQDLPSVTGHAGHQARNWRAILGA